MKFATSLLLAFFLVISFSLTAQSIPSTLRQGVSADQSTINIAFEMQKQGWEYIMPQPKSAKAAWGVRDGRTTWWVGYWQNETTSQTSSTTPELSKGKYIGDDNGGRSWRRGGSPGAPSVLEWLLSKSGGVEPR